MSTSNLGHEASTSRRRRVLLGVILLTAVVVAVALMFRAGTPAPTGSSPPPTTPSTSVTTSSPGHTPTPSTSTPISPVPSATPALLRELGHGAAAARRFDADVAALTRLARSSPDFAAAPSSSGAEGERLLLLNVVHKGTGAATHEVATS